MNKKEILANAMIVDLERAYFRTTGIYPEFPNRGGKPLERYRTTMTKAVLVDGNDEVFETVCKNTEMMWRFRRGQ